jgi:hypothetical protein
MCSEIPPHELVCLACETFHHFVVSLGVFPAVLAHTLDLLREWSWIIRDMAQIEKENTQVSSARHVFLADRPDLSNPYLFLMVPATYINAFRLQQTPCLAE